ncbi:tyrosine-type recombinase/integrase [Evansella clarkii]|uniref:tyrosine-type recombinase/integrase n=1 Tax=Evansella clarkii TaxID=79879 RepID=UPI000B447861|nr:tyrosine-type recombinase/integrase [Evansella clarkii]
MYQEWIIKFIRYLQIEKQASQHTIRNYQRDISDFLDFFCLDKSVEVSYSQVRHYMEELRLMTLESSTVARKLSALRTFYNFLLREGAVEQNPFKMVSVNCSVNKLPPVFYEEEITEMFQSVDTNSPLGKRNLAIIELIYSTGLRVNECVNLNIMDYDSRIGTLLVNSEGRKERYVPVGSFAREALEAYMESGRPALNKNSEKALFLNNRGGRLSDRGIRKIFSRLLDGTADTARLNPRSLREAFAAHMVRAGADSRIVQEILGNNGLPNSRVYSRAAENKLKEIYNSAHPRA